MPDWASALDRDKWFLENAEYFTIVRFKGVGDYERHERGSETEATELAEELVKGNNHRYAIYAVVRNESAFVKAIPDGNRGTWKKTAAVTTQKSNTSTRVRRRGGTGK